MIKSDGGYSSMVEFWIVIPAVRVQFSLATPVQLQEELMEIERLLAQPVAPAFTPRIILVDTKEYQVAYGFSELLDEMCIAERWDEEPWFHGHPKLLVARILALISAKVEGTDYDKLIDLAVELGILHIRGGGYVVGAASGLDVYLKHDPVTGERPQPDIVKNKMYN